MKKYTHVSLLDYKPVRAGGSFFFLMHTVSKTVPTDHRHQKYLQILYHITEIIEECLCSEPR